MKVSHIQLSGESNLEHISWVKPVNTEDQIVVESILAGICSSDVSMYKGDMSMLPIEMHGHEGLGRVVSVGSNVSGVVVGDIVATRGEPAFADMYNVRDGEFVVVPEASPKYILEPVACAVNIADVIGKLRGKSVCIVGTGFLARVIYQVIQFNNKYIKANISVVGNAYPDQWEERQVHIETDYHNKTYDIVVDLSSDPQYFSVDRLNNSGHYIMCAEKITNSLDWAPLLWKNITVSCPSPRATDFHDKMVKAKVLVQKGIIYVDDMWIKGYNKNDAELAFQNRLTGIDKGRTYLKW